MLSTQHICIAALLLVLSAGTVSAQSAGDPSGRDPLWNGTLIGLGAGVGSAMALDAVFCDNGFGGCETPWGAYLALGGIGAAAGAGIDFLIGRTPDAKTTLRLSPIAGRGRQGLLASLSLPQRASAPRLAAAQARGPGRRRDTLWNGALIGAGVGAAGGAVWAGKTCGTTDDECFAIAGPAGIITGAGIGAAVGLIADALRR